MDEQAQDDGQHVEAQLGGSGCQVLNGHDLTSDQTHDAEGRVPGTHRPRLDMCRQPTFCFMEICTFVSPKFLYESASHNNSYTYVFNTIYIYLF